MGGVVSLLNVEQGERVVGTMQMTGRRLNADPANLNAMEVRVEVSENGVPRSKNRQQGG
jgi:HlyD family secretion protein